MSFHCVPRSVIFVLAWLLANAMNAQKNSQETCSWRNVPTESSCTNHCYLERER